MGLKECLAALPGNRPKSALFALFLPFRPLPEGAKSTWEIQKTEEKGLFPQISSDLLKHPSLKRPFAALQKILVVLSAEVRIANRTFRIAISNHSPKGPNLEKIQDCLKC